MSLDVQTLLGPNDLAPVEIVNADSTSPIVLLCEHAGRAISQALGNLGVSEDVIQSHRGWDIGAEKVARQIADLLQAPLVIQRYSRLVLDCNRPPDSPLAIPHVSDQIEISGNASLNAAERTMRVHEIFQPMDAALNKLFVHHPRRAAFSIHSFTSHMNGFDRPWHAGFLARTKTDTAAAMMDHIAAIRSDLTLAMNEPYQIENDSDWFIPAHAEAIGLAHCLIEIRNDQLLDADGVVAWADLLAGAIAATLERAST